MDTGYKIISMTPIQTQTMLRSYKIAKLIIDKSTKLHDLNNLGQSQKCMQDFTKMYARFHKNVCKISQKCMQDFTKMYARFPTKISKTNYVCDFTKIF